MSGSCRRRARRGRRSGTTRFPGPPLRGGGPPPPRPPPAVARPPAARAAAGRRAPPPLAASAAVTVAVRSRSTWGADPGILRAAPRYSPWKKAIVHHTVTTNSYSDAAAQLRSIYYYHSVTRRWGDIGYTS